MRNATGPDGASRRLAVRAGGGFPARCRPRRARSLRVEVGSHSDGGTLISLQRAEGWTRFVLRGGPRTPSYDRMPVVSAPTAIASQPSALRQRDDSLPGGVIARDARDATADGP